jgi:hypothetical protein
MPLFDIRGAARRERVLPIVLAVGVTPKKNGANVDFPTNPFAILTFISAPAVLTNASCVLLFGTGNRYGGAIDRVHELSDTIEKGLGLQNDELQLRIRQLQSAEERTLLIVRALTCFYTAVAGFVASTLVSLIGAVLISNGTKLGVMISFPIAFLAGTFGVLAMITGALMLVQETRFSFRVLREENRFMTQRARKRIQPAS